MMAFLSGSSGRTYITSSSRYSNSKPHSHSSPPDIPVTVISMFTCLLPLIFPSSVRSVCKVKRLFHNILLCLTGMVKMSLRLMATPVLLEAFLPLLLSIHLTNPSCQSDMAWRKVVLPELFAPNSTTFSSISIRPVLLRRLKWLISIEVIITILLEPLLATKLARIYCTNSLAS